MATDVEPSGDNSPALENPLEDRRREPAPGQSERYGRFGPEVTNSLTSLVTATRWATTTAGLIWALATRQSLTEYVAVGLALVAYSMFRTFKPIKYDRRGWRSFGAILTELFLVVAAVVLTEGWNSPYIFSLFTPVIAAGFAKGFGHSLRIAAAAAIAIGVSAEIIDSQAGLQSAIAWTGELMLVAAVASYGRLILQRADAVRSLSEGELWRLNEANAMLVNLNRLAQDLPVSFDFNETIDQAVSRVRDSTKADVSALLLYDQGDGRWSNALTEGALLQESYSYRELPGAAQRAVDHRNHLTQAQLSAASPGFAATSQSGLYQPLLAGERRVGLLVMESADPARFSTVKRSEIEELATTLALTVDNARWFDRLRARGADQERNRIARDLHDRVGQGVAYVAFELDRLATKAEGGPLHKDLTKLRFDARSMVHELRETLHDLRTEVSQSETLEGTICGFLGRVAERSTIVTRFEATGNRRLPLQQEREVWRIAQEAIVNAERHADAGEIEVTWQIDQTSGVLTVKDDGQGLKTAESPDHRPVYGEPRSPGRPSYGLTGMRERADALGAKLEIESDPDAGTTVRLTMSSRRASIPTTNPKA